MRRKGFTLVEVMISLSILSMALIVLMRSTGNNIFQTQRVQMEGVAVDLARGKMYDLEEELAQQGFQQLTKDEDGDFDAEGWPKYSWEAKFEKVELPDLGALQGLGQQEQAKGGAGGAKLPGAAPAKGAKPGGNGLDSSPLGGLLGMMGGSLGPGSNPGEKNGNSFVAGQYQLITQVLQEAIRKVTLTVKWKLAGEDQTLVVSCYFTDPSAIARVVPGGGGAAPTDDGTGSGPGGSGPGGNGRGGRGGPGGGAGPGGASSGGGGPGGGRNPRGGGTGGVP